MFAMASVTSRSVWLSSAAVASSKTSTGGSWYSARAIATRCRCPPDSRAPFSPITVSSFCGSAATTSSSLACDTACASRRLVDRAVGNPERDVAAQRIVQEVDILRDVADLALPGVLAAFERLRRPPARGRSSA